MNGQIIQTGHITVIELKDYKQFSVFNSKSNKKSAGITPNTGAIGDYFTTKKEDIG